VSEMAESISAHVTIADYVDEANGKIIIIGGGIQFVGFIPQMGMTTAFSIFVEMQCPVPVPERHAAVELLLVDASGQAVQVPGEGDSKQALRVAQNVEFIEPYLPGASVPRGSVNARATMTLAFPNGIPLTPGHSYSWRVQIDHDVLATQPFYIPAPQIGPVLG
jgi:hypothetical protein